VQCRQDERPDLPEPDGAGTEDARDEGDLQLELEGPADPGEDRRGLDPTVSQLRPDLVVGAGEDSEDLVVEEPRDDRAEHNGQHALDQTVPQLTQMFHERHRAALGRGRRAAPKRQASALFGLLVGL
jgi:hypothetical protein